MAARTTEYTGPRFPILALLHPREQTRLVGLTLAVGLAAWGIVVAAAGLPIWGATSLLLGLLLIPGARKWQADLRRYGPVVMALSVLLAMQGFHSIEHLVQWIQYHVVHWPPWRSSGLISAANAEWVHFVWNWTVVAVVLYLVKGGMRNVWAWLLLVWAIAHAMEHTYMMVRYLAIVEELGRLGEPLVSAQGLPGILGRDGWLARSPTTQGTFLCRLPGFTSALRLDVHFWWNSGETLLLLLAAHTFLRARLHPIDRTA
ncbi:MAG TPA: hypothetical protein VLA19_21470 [Herpetosiphonaceae bacterium]|nr:hypothetical protein [Herpetosiphonaceae bacterium]